MKIILVNPPYQTITSNYGVGHQTPLGLLMVGGPLVDAGHEVRLIDAECRRLSLETIADEVVRSRPDVVMTGHAGSTPAHPTCIRMLGAIKAKSPGVVTVYGGVYPSYHAARILAEEPAVDVIVQGEGGGDHARTRRGAGVRRLRGEGTPAAGRWSRLPGRR